MKLVLLVLISGAVVTSVKGKAVEIQINSTSKTPKKTCTSGFLYHEASDTCYEEDKPDPCHFSSMVFTFDLHGPNGSNLTASSDVSSIEGLTSGEVSIEGFLTSEAAYDEEKLLKTLEQRQKTKASKAKPIDAGAASEESSSGEHDYTGICDCRVMDLGECKRRPTLYHSATSQCYPMYSQGPCKPEEWFVAREYEEHQLHLIEGACGKNPCTQTAPSGGGQDLDFVYHFKGKCHRTGTQGHCSSADQIAFFSDLSLYVPQCGNLKKYGTLCYADSSEDEEEEEARLLGDVDLDDYEDASVEKAKSRGESSVSSD